MRVSFGFWEVNPMFWTVADVRAITEGDVGLFGVRFRNGRCWGTNEGVGGSLSILDILSGRECDFDLKFGQVSPCLGRGSCDGSLIG